MTVVTKAEVSLKKDVWPLLEREGYTPVWKNEDELDICVEGAKICEAWGGAHLIVRSDSRKVAELLSKHLKILGQSILVEHRRADDNMEQDPPVSSLWKRIKDRVWWLSP